MELVPISFLAGVLTILAPCTITLLPVIIGGSVENPNKLRPFVISLSLGISVLLFTLLLKGTTVFINVPDTVWRIISGGIIIVLALTMIFPIMWDKITTKLKLTKSEELLDKSRHNGSAVLLGASLGPVFTTCSPTYLYIVAVILPQSFGTGLANIATYTAGLFLLLLTIGYGGYAIVKKLKFAANPTGRFRKIIGVILLTVGILILTGADKALETYILDSGYLGPIEIENTQLEKVR